MTGRFCPAECSCGRHKKDSPERAAQRRELMIGINIGRKYGPPSDEHREKNRQGQLRRYSNPEQRALKSTMIRKNWENGAYDRKHPCWGKAGVHAGVKMHCLNSEGGFARDLDYAGIRWEYEPRRFKLSWCTYRPDFYLPEFDTWVEVKGYPEQPGNWHQKIETFRRETGRTLIVVFMSELSSPKYVVGE